MIPETIEEAIHLVCVGHYGQQTAVAREIIRRRAAGHEDDIPTPDALRQRLNELGHGDDSTFARALRLIIEAEDAAGCYAVTEFMYNRTTAANARARAPQHDHAQQPHIYTQS